MGVQAEKRVRVDSNGTYHLNVLKWCADNICVDGEPMEIEDRDYMHALYAHDYPRLVLYTGRQVGKSLFLATKHISKLTLNAPFRSIYISPRSGQTRDWSNDKLKHILETSPNLRYLVPTNTRAHTWQVYNKDLTNGSQFKGRYAYLNADAARGISGDLLSIDELQDVLLDVIPVVEECLSYRRQQKVEGDNFKSNTKKYFIYSGTPKTSSHATDYYWNLSDKREWAVQCRGIGHCRSWNILGYDNIGKKSLICTNCGKKIYAENGRWVITNPGAKWAGFRIPQIMTPWTPIYDPTGEQEDIKTKQQKYPIAKFLNECLAVPYDHGEKPLSPEELYACCDENLSLVSSPSADIYNRIVFAGIDWGGGSGSDFSSYTVLTLGAYWHPGILTIFYMKKFEGVDSDLKAQPDIIGSICQRYNVKLIAADYGFGTYQNRLLKEKFGNKRVMEIQYAETKNKLKYNDQAQRMMANRTMCLQDMFSDIQKKNIRFFRQSEFEKYGQDILNIYIDYNDKRQVMKYDHAPHQPDDCAHSISYCILAAKYFNKLLTR